jgi:hypothetical protein
LISLGNGEDTPVQLVSEEALAGTEEAFRQLLPTLPVSAHGLSSDPAIERCLTFFLLLTHAPDLLPGQVATAEQLFYSRYYWFRRYQCLITETGGPNAGLAQQAFQLLEHPSPECIPDWSFLQTLDQRATHDAASQLRARA